MKPTDKPLTVEVKDDQLQISVGISTLAQAFRLSPANFNGVVDRFLFKVLDETDFAKAVARFIDEESETGETKVTELLDAAFESLLHSGDADDSLVNLEKT